MDRDDLLPIGEVAARSGVSVATLRFYEERGLVESTRTAGNQRRYERHVLRRVAVVRAGQRFGLSLTEIGDALESLLARIRAEAVSEADRVARGDVEAAEEHAAATAATVVRAGSVVQVVVGPEADNLAEDIEDLM